MKQEQEKKKERTKNKRTLGNKKKNRSWKHKITITSER